MIQSAPELANGIIVSERDFERVRNLLKNSPQKTPRQPITIATPAAFHDLDRTSSNLFVVGPANNAWFDKDDAQKELLNLEEQSDQIEENLHKAENTFNQFNDVTLRFKLFRQRFGRGWFAEQQANLTKGNVELEDLQAELENARDEKQRISLQRRDNEQKAQKIRSEIVNIQHIIDRLSEFGEELEGNVDLWNAEILRLNGAIDQARKDADKLKAEAEELRNKANTSLQDVQPIAENARLLEAQITAVRYVKAPLPEPKQGNVEALKTQYERLVEQTERELGNDELVRLAEISEKQARKYRNDAQNKISKLVPKMTLKEVKSAIDSLANPNDVELKAQKAEEYWYELGKRERDQESSLTELRLTLEQHEKSWLGAGKPTLPAELTRSFNPKLSEEFSEKADQFSKECSILRLKVRENEKSIADQKHLIESLQKDSERLGSVRRSNPGFTLERELPLDDVTILYPDEISPQISNLEKSLEEHQKNTERLNEQRRSIAQNVKKWVDDARFSGLQNRIIAQFRSHDPETLENSAAQYREELALRVREISNTLNDIEKHRSMLSKLILNAAEEGLRLLKLADRSSQVPIEIPDIGGSQFLRISTKEPSSTTDRLDLIQDLVDILIDENAVPTGIELVQRAVRQLAHPFRVRVLNPDPGSPQRFIEITETARFSGGEQLTCAILLYCTLANVRARTRGLNRQPTGVLLLDNPIGRASRAMFIDMQRQFASAMGIQLIYTTAVNDLEALSILPNVIRLRNERVDKNRGHRLLEHDVEITGMLDALHVGKIEDKKVSATDPQPVADTEDEEDFEEEEVNNSFDDSSDREIDIIPNENEEDEYQDDDEDEWEDDEEEVDEDEWEDE